MDRSVEMIEIVDSGYLLTGWIGNGDTIKGTSSYLIKTDLNGDTIWTRSYNQLPAVLIFTVSQLIDSGFIVGGNIENSDTSLGPSDSYIVRFNSLGDTVWTRIYYGPNSGWISKIISTHDQNYLLQGNLTDSVSVVAKIKDLGDTIWTIDTLFGIDIKNSIDSNYILLSSKGQQLNNDISPRVAKIGTDGSLIWDKLYKYAFNFWPKKIITTVDNGYMVMGGYSETDLLKLNSSGDSLWSAEIDEPGTPIPTDIIQTADGGFMVLGTVTGGFLDSDLYLLKIDANGQKEWSTALFRPGYDEIAKNIAQHGDGGYVIFGWGEQGPIGDDDWLFAKTDSMGVILGIWDDIEDEEMQFMVYPNPATDKVQFTSKQIFTGTLKLYDITGKLLWQMDADRITGWVIPVVNLKSGIYILTVYDTGLRLANDLKIIKY